MENCREVLHPSLEKAFLDECRYEYDENFGGCMVEVPLKLPNMDNIRLWVKQTTEAGNTRDYTITDAGKTYSLFFSANLNLDSPNRENVISAVESRYDLEEGKHEVRLDAKGANLGDRLLDAIQAVQSLSHLTITRQPYNRSTFEEDVAQYIIDFDLEVMRDVSVEGPSREWEVDMEVMNGHTSYVETLHADTKSYAESLATRDAYMWVELSDVISDVEFVSVVDDVDGAIGDNSLRMLENRSDSVVQWSEKEGLVEELQG